VPPDRRGLPHENDVASLKEFGRLVRETFAADLAAGARVTASDVRGKAREFAAANLVDGRKGSYWATNDGVRQAEVVVEMKTAARMNVVRLRERIELGQRVERFQVEAEQEGGWRVVAEGTSIGACRICRLSGDVETRRVRVRILESAAEVALAELGLYREA